MIASPGASTGSHFCNRSQHSCHKPSLQSAIATAGRHDTRDAIHILSSIKQHVHTKKPLVVLFVYGRPTILVSKLLKSFAHKLHAEIKSLLCDKLLSGNGEDGYPPCMHKGDEAVKMVTDFP
jgi:hypothetical protein